jgi:hypothetical protein
LRADQQGHDQDDEDQRAEEAVEFAAEDQDAAGDHDADDRQREGDRAGDGVAQVGQPAFIRQRAAGAFRGESVLGGQQEERQEGEPGPCRTRALRLRGRPGRLLALVNSLQGFGDVLAVGVPGNLQDFLHAAAFGCAGDMNDDMNRLADQRFNRFRGIRVHADEAWRLPSQPLLRVVGVEGCSAAFVPGVPGISRSRASGPRTSPTRIRSGRMRRVVFSSIVMDHVDAGVVLDEVLGGALDFAGVLDDENPFGRVLNHHLD